MSFIMREGLGRVANEPMQVAVLPATEPFFHVVGMLLDAGVEQMDPEVPG